MNKVSFFLLTILILLNSQSALSLYSSLSPSFRGYPVSGTVEGMLGNDWYIYDQRSSQEPWKFGLWSLRAKGAVHGLMDVGLHVYPVSFVKISAVFGGTYRFYNPPNFNCAQNLCQGFLAKTSLGFSFVMVFGEQDEYLITPQYQSSAVSHGQSGKRIVDETELLLAAAGGDTLDQTSLFVGKRLNSESVMGVYFKQSQYRRTLQQSEMQLLVLNWDWNKTGLRIGLGRYASDIYTPGLTATIVYEWKSGEGLALF